MEKFIDLVKVRFENNVQIYLAHASRIHNYVTKEILTMKWRISDSNSKATLEATNHMCVRSAILPLSRIYLLDLLTFRLCWLEMKCFIAILFAGVKSLIGNTCA